MDARVPSEVIRVGNRIMRVVALADERASDTRFDDGDGGEIVIHHAPVVAIPRRRPPRKRAA